MKARNTILVGLALAAALLAGCETRGDSVEGATEATGDAIENAADATGDAMEDAADSMSDVADDVTGSAIWDRIEGNWKQFTGSVKERWAELNDDEIGELDGNKDQLIGKVQETYGVARGEAEAQVDEWANAQ